MTTKIKEGNGYIFKRKTVSLLVLFSILLITAVGSVDRHYKIVVNGLEGNLSQLQKDKEEEVKKSAGLTEELRKEKDNNEQKEKELLESKNRLKELETRNSDLEKELNLLSKEAEIKRIAKEEEKKKSAQEASAIKEKSEAKPVQKTENSEPSGGWVKMSVEATAYTMVANGDEMGGTGLTSTGKVPTAYRTVAVDPSVIPYGSLVQYNGTTYVAEDTGGVIKGNKIDFYKDTLAECTAFGRQTIEVLVKTP